MFGAILYTEVKKYKRTMIPWLVGIAGFLTAGTAFLLVSAGNSQVSWTAFAARGLNCINPLALLLVAVFTGHTFAGEYSEGVISILFTYPVSRFRLYAAKHLAILLLIVSLYLAFFLSVMFFGLINIGSFPGADLLLKFFKAMALTSGVSFVLVPVTALISNIVKAAGTYLLAGMGYITAYMIFIGSDYGLYLPPCIPDKLAANYLVKQCLGKTDFQWIAVVCTATFLSAFITGAVYYSKSDVYK